MRFWIFQNDNILDKKNSTRHTLLKFEFKSVQVFLLQIEYAWVSQEQVTAKSDAFWTDSDKRLPTAKYDLKIEHNIMDPFILKAQDTFNIEFEITNTNPVTHLEFDISEMLGDADALSFGFPSVEFGEAYRHDHVEGSPGLIPGKLIHIDPIISSSGGFQISK